MLFLWACHEKWFYVASIAPAEVSQASYLLWKSHQHNKSWPLYSVLWKLLFILNTFTFDNIYSGQYLWNKFISLDYIQFQCKSTVILVGLFDYFQHGEVFFLTRDGVQYPKEFLLLAQELMHFTQEILSLLPTKLRTPYSRNLRVPIH